MALTNMGFNDKFGLILEDQNRREREGRGKERRRGRGREEEEKRGRRREVQARLKVWKLTLIMDSMKFGMNLWFCMIIILP